MDLVLLSDSPVARSATLNNFSGAEAVFDSVAPQLLEDISKFSETLSETQVAEFHRIISLSVQAGEAWEAQYSCG